MESYFLAILSIVLANVLVINSWRIEPATAQVTFFEKQNSEEKLAEDGAFYSPNKIGGPVSAKMYEIHPQLAYLGDFNQKFWYIERTALTYAEARLNCSSMGMSIARTDYQSELNFIFGVTGSTDLPWVGAALPMQLSSYIWEGTANEFPSSVQFTAITTSALRIVRATNSLTSLTPATVSTGRFALCTIPKV